MNILFLYGGAINPERGGVQRVTEVLADEFARRGNRVLYLSLPNGRKESTGSERQHFLVDDDVTSEKNREFLKEFLVREQIDVLINQGGNGKEFSRLAYTAKEQKVPVVSVLHCGLIDSAKNYRAIHEQEWKRKGLGWLVPVTDFAPVKSALMWLYKQKYKKHYRELCACSTRVILLSEQFKPELGFFLNGNKVPENVLAIPNPCSFPAAGTGLDLSKKRKELLFVGRIDFSQKRVDLLLKIWGLLHKKFADWELTVVGGGVALEESKQAAKKAGLERISFEGFVPPQAYYERASVFCMTSAWETFGLVLVEAMNYGCVPVAFHSYASASDIIKDGEDGFLIPPMSCEIYAEKLSSLMNDAALRDRMAKVALEKSKRFSIERIGDTWEKMLNSL